MKVFDHISVADITAGQRNESVWYTIVSMLARAYAHAYTQSVVGKGSLRMYTWTVQRGCSSSVKVKRYFKSIRWIYM